MTAVVKINVARDFTRFPSGRYRPHGNTSGQAFREDLLEGPLRLGEQVEVELDGTVGYGSSFLEECFGGLVRALGVPAKELLARLTITTADPALRDEIVDYIEEASKRSR